MISIFIVWSWKETSWHRFCVQHKINKSQLICRLGCFDVGYLLINLLPILFLLKLVVFVTNTLCDVLYCGLSRHNFDPWSSMHDNDVSRYPWAAKSKQSFTSLQLVSMIRMWYKCTNHIHMGLRHIFPPQDCDAVQKTSIRRCFYTREGLWLTNLWPSWWVEEQGKALSLW